MNLTTPAAAMVPVVLSDPAFLAYSRDLIAQNNQRLISGLQVLKTSATRDDVPITLFYTDQDVDLGALFWNTASAWKTASTSKASASATSACACLRTLRN